MKLRVAFRQPGAAASGTNVQITADATATAGDVARALALGPGADREVPDAAELTLRLVNGGGVALAPKQSLVSSGLRSGSVIELARAAEGHRTEATRVAVLRVVGGPDEGVEVPLAIGTYTVGRHDDCDIRLSDMLVSKRHATVTVRDTVELADDNSANGIVVGGVRVQRVALGPGDVAQLGATLVSVQYLRRPTEASVASTDIAFIRSPRVVARRQEQKVELPAPPREADRARFPWLAMLAPVIMGGVMFAVTRSAMSLAFVALSPLLMIGNWVAQRSEAKGRHKRAVAEFEAQLEAAQQRLASIHDLERAQLEALHPSVAECVHAITQHGDALWCRRPEHPEFLQVRLGRGDIAPAVTVEGGNAAGLPEFTRQRDELAARFVRLTDAPVVADLRCVGGLGVSGVAGVVDGVARAVAAQVVALHAPSEVVVTCLTSAVGRERWSWLEWLPHSASEHSPIGTLQLSADAGTGRLLLDRLEGLVAARLGDKDAIRRGPLGGKSDVTEPVLPSVLVVVDDASVDLGRLTRLAERGPDAGVHVLWIAAAKAELPAACRTYLDLGAGESARVGMVRSEELLTGVRCESLDAATATSLAKRLAPVVDAGAPVDDASDVPRMVSVVSLLGQTTADDPELIVSHWRENGSLVDRSRGARPRERAGDLRALIGHTGAEPFTLDLRAQGPHALVGGTTGSGKSEFLQAWVLGLSHAYSPDRVTFLFVDYKGGAAFEKLKDALPHSVGMVTDLSPYLVRRVLRSLRAEIHHREALLRDKGVKDLIDFELTGDPECPPSLIIVVDEFAALKSEVPEFFDGVIDIAQRGRSLGLHLIMATQRPAGVITDSLRANTNLRVALRMNDEHDSADVLGDTMAARFDPSVPGRGAARTGPGRIQQFQSAFPGARTPAVAVAPPVEVVELDFGLGVPWKLAKPASAGAAIAKDIDRVVTAVGEAARRGAVPKPRRPWLDPLAPAYNLEKLSQRTDAELVLGVMDDPDHQRQYTRFFRPDEEGNVLYLGTGGSGKTTALRTLAIAAGIVPRGGPVHVYGLDFAGGGLSMLDALPYVGTIVPGDDEERVARLLRMLTATLEERYARYTAVRAATIANYRQLANRPREPRILLLLDGFGAFRSEYDSTIGRVATYDAFQRILSEGRPVGIHVAMTADRSPTVPTALAATFQCKVVLRQTDEDGYLSAGVPKDVLNAASPPGRAMLVGDPQELQLAIMGEEASPAAQGRLLEELGSELAPLFPERPAPVRSLPTLVTADGLPASIRGLPVLGIEDATLAAMGFDPRGPVLITGPQQSGRTTAMRWFAESLRRWLPDTPLVHLTARPSALSSAGIWAGSLTGAADVAKYCQETLHKYLQTPLPDERPMLAVFIENLPDFASTPADLPLQQVLQLARRNGHPCFVEGEISSVSPFGPLLTEAKQARTGLLLQPESADETLLRTPLPRCKRTDFPPGRGIWVRGGRTTKVQLPVVD